ncbi:MAG TPA: hypothetical protein IAA98_03285 [Candidatus Avipropionibacterium avicola]|uniref:Neutral/alkaline non-lysosomal ceramidase N-terminal domain-containing protein n=1 Tax=Candidatus Avipropionibacterium avicola TaxID=2840701 RepID=A0A9D1GW38_9ACTN|nr:hypothetical protein [Candidatus Avipropionibacterium avicola]
MVTIGARHAVPAFHGLAGVVVGDVTPPVGIRARNWGPATWDAATGVHRPMVLTAVALADEDAPRDPVVMVGVDATWWRRVDDERRCRDHVLQASGLSPERLLISLSHTHAGPVICSADRDLPGGEHLDVYLGELARTIADAVRRAIAALAPAVLEWAHSRCDLASNRELLLEDGCGAGPRPVVGYNPVTDDPADDTVLVGRLSGLASDGTASPLATIVNYACHPTTLAWQNSLISPDWVAGMRELVEESTGAPLAFVQGASGELAPRQQYVGDTAVAEQHGRQVGHAVLSALESLPPVGTDLELTGVVESGAPLAIWEPRSRTEASSLRTVQVLNEAVELDLQPLPGLDELAEQWADIDPRSREERLQRARNLRDDYVLGPTVQHPVWAWRIGTALLIAHPGEAYSRLQRTVRHHVGDFPVLVANLTNGPGFVYLPTQQAYEVNAYQAWQTPLAPGSLERLEAHASTLLDRLIGTEVTR